MRPTIAETMLELAHVWAKRGTCAKRQVGCVAIDENGHVLSSGYNGQPRRHTHCTLENPCPAFDNADLSCVAIHAEMNALMRCSDIDKIHTVYITTAPCDKCLLAIKNTRAQFIVYTNEPYSEYTVLYIGR
jgi:dCMP deaminase